MAKVQHIALMKFKGETTEEQIDKAFDEFLDLSETVDGIENYVSGSNNSPEGQNHGYTHGYVMTFADAAARDAYLSHAALTKLRESLAPLVDSTVVFDFEL
jgi:hypothetical protein